MPLSAAHARRASSERVRAAASLPNGVVTFLLTDIVGSTRAWQSNAEAMRTALARHDQILARCVEEQGGTQVESGREGDSILAVFTSASAALECAAAVQRAFASEPWLARPIQVRIALNTGEAQARDGHYFGLAVYRCARLLGTGHGGQILLTRATFELVRDSPPAGVTVVDLGEHRLKDLERAERVFQACVEGLEKTFPPLNSLDRHRHNLPLVQGELLGREKELREIGALLDGERPGVITLKGSGGTGKTRLALQIAAENLERFPDGVWFVDLTPVRDPGLVPDSIARAMGLREIPGRTLTETIAAELTGRSVLLLLDNFEQVVGAATNIAAMLAESPAAAALVTSREDLRLRGEHLYQVDPLSTIDGGPAERMFVGRVKWSDPEIAFDEAALKAVRGICSRLDGLPLAIELAAARVRVLSPQEILDRLGDSFDVVTGGARDVPPRQRALVNTFDWSYGLLTPEEQRMLKLVSVFRGGFTLAAAEHVAGGRVGVLDLIDSLVGKSLVRKQSAPRGSRFVLLQTIQDFALDRLEAAGEADEARRMHAEYFLATAEREGPRLMTPAQQDAEASLVPDLDNLRAAVDWYRHTGNIAARLRLAGAVHWLWHLQGIADGGGWLEGLREDDDSVPASVRASALEARSLLVVLAGDEAATAKTISAIERLVPDCGMDSQKRMAWVEIIRAFLNMTDIEHARGLLDRARERLAAGDDVYRCWSDVVQGEVERAAGNMERAVDLNRNVLGRGSDRFMGLVARVNLAEISVTLGRLGDCEEYLGSLFNVRPSPPVLVWMGSTALAAVLLGRARPKDAAEVMGAIDAWGIRTGSTLQPHEQALRDRTERGIRAELDDTEYGAAYDSGSARSLSDTIARFRPGASVSL